MQYNGIMVILNAQVYHNFLLDWKFSNITSAKFPFPFLYMKYFKGNISLSAILPHVYPSTRGRTSPFFSERMRLKRFAICILHTVPTVLWLPCHQKKKKN